MKPHFSEIKVSPKSWKTKLQSNLKNDWTIYYNYFCDDFPNGKPIRFKGMNHEKTLEARQAATEILINNEIENLKKEITSLEKRVLKI